MLEWPAPLDPGEEKDFAVDWSKALAGDQIVGSTWSVSPAAGAAGVVLGVTSRTASATVVWVSIATAHRADPHNTAYELINIVTTSGGRRLQRTVKLRVFRL